MKLRRVLVQLGIVILLYLCPFLQHGNLSTLTKFPVITGDGLWDGFPSAIYFRNYSFWNPFVNLGAPNLVFPHHQPLYLPSMIWMQFFDPILAFNTLLLLHAGLLAFFSYLFFRSIDCHRLPSLLGGLAMSCCGFFSTHFDHHYMVHVATWIPLALLSVERHLRAKHPRWLLLTVASIAMTWYAGHPQIALYGNLLAAAYVAFRSYENSSSARGRIRSMAWLYAAMATGCVAALPQILPILESFPYIQRSSLTLGTFIQYSLPPNGLIMYLFPAIFGVLGSTRYEPVYAGPWNSAELTPYVSFIVLSLAIAGLIYARRLNLIFWFAVAACSLLFSIGDLNPLHFLLFHVPGVNLFRVPARWLYLTSFSIIVIATLVLDAILISESLRQKLLRTAVKVQLALLLAGCAAVYALRRLVLEANPQQLGERFWLWKENGLGGTKSLEILRRSIDIASPSITLPIAFMLLTILLFWVGRRIPPRQFCVCAVALCMSDLYSFGHYFTDWPETQSLQERTLPLRAVLQKAESPSSIYRLLPVDDYTPEELWPRTNAVFGLRTPNNYGPIQFKDYLSLTGFLTSGYCSACSSLISSNRLLSILSVKYLATKNPAIIENALRVGCGSNDNAVPAPCREETLYPRDAWMLRNAKEGSKLLELAASSAGEFSAASKGFPIQPETDYTVAFEARQNRTRNQSDGGLRVQLFNYQKGYMRPELERGVNGISPNFRPYSVTINSGARTPIDAEIRLYTLDRSRIELRNISVCRSLVPSKLEVPCMGETSGSTRRAVYTEISRLSNGVSVLRNNNALPIARFVRRATLAENTIAVQNAFLDPMFNPELHALVEDVSNVGSFADGAVVSYNDSAGDTINVTAKTSGPALLVLSLLRYPGWRASVDGVAVPLEAVYGVMTGVKIPGAGSHRIELQFIPDSFFRGLFIGATGILFFAFAVWLKYRRRSPSNSGEL